MTNMLAHNNKIAKTDVNALSEEETKQYLTPFAFKLDKSLFGLPLASPSKRGIALLIDLGIIALLSEVTGVFLALAIAITLYYLGNKKRAKERGKTKGRKRRAIMRFIAAMVVFVVLLDTLPPLLKYVGIEETKPRINKDENSLSLAESIALTGTAISAIKTLAESNCQEFACWKIQLDSVAVKVATISYEGDIKIASNQLNEIFSDLIEDVDLPAGEIKQLKASMRTSYDKELSRLVDEQKSSPSKAIVEGLEETNTQTKDKVFVFDDDAQLTDVAEFTKKEKSNKPVYSIIEWIKGIIEDLGLGFGWATFYFTVLIALGKGQTFGKKLLGIKVLQLDGTPLSLWDSFGRYGGYGAGVATGLLGFIQIYWDPNRQAIHDQISATVVIDVKKSRLQMNQDEQKNITEVVSQ